MPIVKHICVHYNAKRTLRYVLDPDKTDDLLWATSINCMTEPDLAYTQMAAVYEQFARDHFNSPSPLVGNGTVKVIHYIQSFSPDDNVTPEQAHKIAKAFVRYAFGDDAPAVIATHVDKDHIHSHIVLNSYSLSGQKFYANKASLRRLREISDGVSKAFGIDIHPNLKGEGRSMQYNEWQHRKNGTSWKQHIRDEIDKLIGEVTSLDELLQLLEERGYEVKRGKYISIKAHGQERFVRTKTLGEEYTEESLNIRITYRDMGTVMTPTQDEQNNLSQAYAAVLNDVRILATQHKKVPRKQIITAEYTVDNDLDVYRLSAQLSVINQEHIHSIGELEGRINEQRKEYEKYRVEVNSYIDEYNKLAGVLEQAEQYYELAKKPEPSESEQLKMKICWQTMLANHIMTAADVDDLRGRVAGLNKKIGGLREKLNECKQKYDVFTDIQKAYAEISKQDYISGLVEEERQRQEKVKKKKRSR